MSGSDLKQRLAAILAADVAGYSRLMAADDRATVTALDAARKVFRAAIESSQGRVVDMAGDSVLAVFDTATGAVIAALAVQAAINPLADAAPEERRMRFRIGVHLGDVIEKSDGTIYGDGVNIAARLEGLALPGGITVSESIRTAVKGKVDAGFEDQGRQTVKNIPDPVHAYRVRSAGVMAEQASDSARAVDLTTPAEPSIAVLPFANLSGDPEQEYFTDGISEDIITEIARIPTLFVISRNSTFTYKGKAARVEDICRDLGVRYVLDGSVRKSGQRVRVTAQLTDGESGRHIWAERYDRELADIFAVQDDVTAHIVRALAIKLAKAGSSHAVRPDGENPEAYDCVLRGREQYRLFTPEGNAAARRHYEKAITLDARNAEAHAGLAQTHMQDWFGGAAEGIERAFDAAEKARSLDPHLPLVYEALSTVLLFKRQHDAALAAARRWTEIEPNNAEAHANLAGIMNFAGEPERVADLIEKAKRLNPFYPFYYTLYLGQACFVMRQFEDAARFISRSIAHNPASLPAHLYLAACHGQRGENQLAREALAEVRRISPAFSLAAVRTVFTYRRPADLELLTVGLRVAGLQD